MRSYNGLSSAANLTRDFGLGRLERFFRALGQCVGDTLPPVNAGTEDIEEEAFRTDRSHAALERRGARAWVGVSMGSRLARNHRRRSE